jgi:hypothetical protein
MGEKQIDDQHERFFRSDLQSVCKDTLNQLGKSIIIIIIIIITIIIFVLQPGSSLDRPSDANEACSLACISWGFLTRGV